MQLEPMSGPRRVESTVRVVPRDDTLLMIANTCAREREIGRSLRRNQAEAVYPAKVGGCLRAVKCVLARADDSLMLTASGSTK
jgi:hypothetical protein